MSDRFALITGASGFLGSHLNNALQVQGYQTIGWQNRNVPNTQFTVKSVDDVKSITDQLDVCINLAGAPIADKPWTAQRKNKLRDSRIGFTQNLLKGLSSQGIAINHFISGSAIGIYGTGEEPFTEDSPQGKDFPAQLCSDWEAALTGHNNSFETTTLLRTGLVLGDDGGFLSPFRLLRNLRLRVQFGRGQQGQSWISLEDWVNAVIFTIQHKVNGAVNVTAPNPVSHKDFLNALFNRKKALKLPVPAFAFMPLGEMKTLFIDGQFVIPKKLVDEGFQFKHSTIEKAFAAILE